MTMQEHEFKLLVDAWNAHNWVGIGVRVLLDDGSYRKTTTLSDAWLDEAGMPVIRVNGIGGPFRLLRVAVDWA
jgi:hypothetical protein